MKWFELNKNKAKLKKLSKDTVILLHEDLKRPFKNNMVKYDEQMKLYLPKEYIPMLDSANMRQVLQDNIDAMLESVLKNTDEDVSKKVLYVFYFTLYEELEKSKKLRKDGIESEIKKQKEQQ